MENKLGKLKYGLEKAGKSAADILDKAKKTAVSAVDQNDDGKFDVKDLSAIEESVRAAVKDNSEKWADRQAKSRYEKDLKELRPFFAEDTEKPDFSLPKLIRIAEMDEKHAASPACRDSIGFYAGDKELSIMTVFPDKIDIFDLKFYPELDSGLYYVDPIDRDYYISLDEYFNYLRIARISELQKIAQDLGAVHFRVTYKEQEKKYAANDMKVRADLKLRGRQGGDVSVEQHAARDDFSKMEIAAEMVFIGHAPVEPTLAYFRKDPQIQNLVALRMSNNQLKHQTYNLNLSSSCGIKEKDAVKIDAAIKSLKLGGNATVASEVQSESRRILEYEIDF